MRRNLQQRIAVLEERLDHIEKTLLNRRNNKHRKAQVYAMHDEGKSVIEISQALNMTYNSVYSILYVLGVQPNTRKSTRWSKEMDATRRRMRDEGCSAAEIGKALGKTRESVQQRNHRYP